MVHCNDNITIRKDLPKKVKIAVCTIPAYPRVPPSLNVNYDYLPDRYGDVPIMTERLDEIMAGKLISLVNTTDMYVTKTFGIYVGKWHAK